MKAPNITPGDWLPLLSPTRLPRLVADSKIIATSDASMGLLAWETNPERQDANMRFMGAAPTMAAALQCPDLDAAHDALSKALEGDWQISTFQYTERVRVAATKLCVALNAHHESRRQALLAAGFTEEVAL